MPLRNHSPVAQRSNRRFSASAPRATFSTSARAWALVRTSWARAESRFASRFWRAATTFSYDSATRTGG